MRLLPPLSLALLIATTVAASAALAAPASAPPPAPPTAAYYLPPGVDYDPAIPLPKSSLGFEVGEWHARHDQLVDYYQLLDRLSERMKLEEIGRTYEQRPLLNLYVSSPANLARLDEILERHARLSERPASGKNGETGQAGDAELDGLPLVVYLGYSIHGNESSGSNAALLVAYHLAAARGPEIDRLLEQTLVVLDPSLNPDGLARFAQWANQNRGRVPVADPRHREHVEPWPNGRTNHYGFDLNRDWLLAAHPESRARLRQFHRLRPNLLADYHEMGTDGTFFFQPGVPSRQNPLTPASNLELTRRIAEYHARALDRIGSLYYTEESFDDFYFGKGSTYPDIQGAVGILFEQASSRGHVQESAGGLVTFPFTIRNQFTASLSTLEAAVALRRELLEQQRTFYREALAEAAADPRQAIVFGDGADPRRAFGLAQLLRRHRVEVHQLAQLVEADGVEYRPGSAYVVPVSQPQYRLLRGLFEQPTTFADETFYDVSAWTLPLAFALPHAELGAKAFRPALLGAALGAPDELEPPAGQFVQRPDAMAYAFSWRAHFAARALYRLESRGILARAATRDFGVVWEDHSPDLGRGAIVVPLAGQPLSRAELESLLGAIAREEGVDIVPITSGLTPGSVIDIGSPSLRLLKKPRPAIVVGQPYDISEAGEIWYLLDERFGIETTLLERRDLARADLSRYSHLIFVSAMGSAELQKNELEAVKTFVRAGGTLVASGTAAVWAESQILRPPPENAGAPGPGGRSGDGDKPEKKVKERKAYGDFEKDSAHDLVAGAIFEVDLDLTHPLAYGYTRPLLPVFRVHQETMPMPEDPYSRVAVYTAQPRLAGFASDDNLKKIAGSPAVVAERMGRGTVVRYLDNANFRGYWWGGSKLFLNGLFFSGLIEDTGD